MGEWLRALAESKGLAIEPGSELRLELLAFPSGGTALLALLGLATALIGIAAIYRRDGQTLRPRQRALLVALRGAAVIAALLVVTEPSLVAIKKEERPGQVLLLLDVSQSMAQKDAFRRDGVATLRDGWRDIGVGDPAASSRFELALRALGWRDGLTVRELAARNQLHAYAFAAGIEPIAIGTPTAIDSNPLDLTELAPAGHYTDLGGAVRGALERSRDAAIAAVVLLSDGRRTAGAPGAEIARLLGQRQVRHTLVLPIGDPSETQIVQLDRVDAPEKVFQRDPFRVQAHLLAQGYDATTVTVRLLVGENTAAAAPMRVVQTLGVVVGGDTGEAIAAFDQVVADAPGTYTYRVEVEPPSGEALSPTRHVAETQIEVLDQQTRVLLIAGGPSHEYRFLQTALTRDKTIEVRCWLQSADPNFPQDGDVSIAALPLERREIEDIDVIVLLDPDPQKLTREFCAMVATHVLDNGAGLWWVAGEKFTLESWRDDATTKPLADLAPIVPDIVRADREVVQFGHGFARAVPWQLTPAGNNDPLTNLRDSPEGNAAFWAQLPGYHFAFPALRGKPGATVLAAIAQPAFGRPGETAPLFAYQFVGAGRSLYLGTDETYRWRAAHEDAYHALWVKGIRFLYEGRLTASNSRLRLRLSAEQIGLGESLRISAEAKDDSYRPLAAASLDVTVEPPGGASETVRLEPVAQAPGEYQAIYRPRLAGFHHVTAAVASGKTPRAEFQVVPPAFEKEGPVDLAELESIAAVPGGELLQTPQQLAAAVARLPSLKATDTFRTTHPIWDTWVTIAIVLSLLSAEWWLRKRFNLL